MNEATSVAEIIASTVMIAVFAWAVVRMSLGVRLAEKNAVLNKENSQLRDRILRAQRAFFGDGSDGDVAAKMVEILMEEDPRADI